MRRYIEPQSELRLLLSYVLEYIFSNYNAVSKFGFAFMERTGCNGELSLHIALIVGSFARNLHEWYMHWRAACHGDYDRCTCTRCADQSIRERIHIFNRQPRSRSFAHSLIRSVNHFFFFFLCSSFFLRKPVCGSKIKIIKCAWARVAPLHRLKWWDCNLWRFTIASCSAVLL